MVKDPAKEDIIGTDIVPKDATLPASIEIKIKIPGAKDSTFNKVVNISGREQDYAENIQGRVEESIVWMVRKWYGNVKQPGKEQ